MKRPVSTALVPVPRRAPPARVDPNILEQFWLGKSPRTVKAYQDDIARICEWAGQPSVKEFAAFFFALTPGGAFKLANEFKSWGRTAKHWSPSYVNNHLAALRSLVKFARRIEHIVWTLDIEDVPHESSRARSISLCSSLVSITCVGFLDGFEDAFTIKGRLPEAC